MHEKGHCFYGVPFSRPFSGSRSQERGRKHGRAGRIGILLWHRGRAIYLLPDSQGVVHRPRFQTDNWRRENSIWLDVGPYGAFHTQRLAGRTKPGKKQGQGRPTKIYVKNFIRREEVKTSEKRKSALPETGSLDFLKSETINTDKNYTESNDTDPSIYPAARLTEDKPPAAADRIDTIRIYREILKENIEYDHLCERVGYDRDMLDEMLEILVAGFQPHRVCDGQPAPKHNKGSEYPGLSPDGAL